MLVDDERRGLNSLRRLLELNCPDISIIEECRHSHEAAARIAEVAPDLVFLDIAMPKKSGFDLLNDLSPVPFEVIFVTAHSEYTLQAFKYSAVDYLLKPVDESLLIDAVKRAARRIGGGKTSAQPVDTFMYNVQMVKTPAEMKLCIADMKGFRVLLLSEVIYCESDGSYTSFHLLNGQVATVSKSIIEYELLLEKSGFCRTHKSFLVNLHHVREYVRGEGGSVILSNGCMLEVSRRKKEVFMTRMKELLGH